MKGAYGNYNGDMTAEKAMLPYLEKMQRSGVDLFLDGEAVCFDEVVRQTVQEPCAYMADYVIGESGDIEQIRFDRVDFW